MALLKILIALCISFMCLSCSDRYLHSVKQVTRADEPNSIQGDTAIIAAGSGYAKGAVHQLLLGQHYRRQWATTVTVPVFDLSKAYGGVKPVKIGGGRQTINLRLEDEQGRQYVLRSVDKNPSGALSRKIQRSPLANWINDMTTSAHPYAALTVPPIADAVGVYHTNPQLVYVPYSDNLGNFQEEVGGMMAILEERPDDDWSMAPHFGNSKNIVSTKTMLEDLLADNDYHVDSRLYLKSRLLDIFLGDWSRHEDNWRWATFEDGKGRFMQPIPRDRDHVYFKFSGLIPKLLVWSRSRSHFPAFSEKIKRVTKFNKSGRNLDRLLLPWLTKEEWMDIADEVQNALTDEVIHTAIRQLPAEIYKLDSASLTNALISRRNGLKDAALEYYSDLQRHVEIVGTDKHEKVVVEQKDEGLVIQLFKIKKDGTERKLLGKRIFSPSETKSISIYTLGGEDIFQINGNTLSSIKVRLYGGAGEDTYSSTASKSRVNIEDTSKGNEFNIRGAKVHLPRLPDLTSFDRNGWLLRYNIWD